MFFADLIVGETTCDDKCAAGTGRFLSMACDTLVISLDEIDTFAHGGEAIVINSMCTVFAESEIIGALAMQKDRAKIMTGVLQSIAQKIRQMAGKFDLSLLIFQPFYFLNPNHIPCRRYGAEYIIAEVSGEYNSKERTR